MSGMKRERNSGAKGPILREPGLITGKMVYDIIFDTLGVFISYNKGWPTGLFLNPQGIDNIEPGNDTTADHNNVNILPVKIPVE